MKFALCLLYLINVMMIGGLNLPPLALLYDIAFSGEANFFQKKVYKLKVLEKTFIQ